MQAVGPHAPHHGADRWIEIDEEGPLILRMPLVRQGSASAVGLDEAAWKG